MKRKAFIIVLIAALIVLVAVCIIVFNDLQKGVETFTVNDTLPDGGGKEATVILIGGQSNASGCSRDDCLQQNVSEEKYTEYKNGYDNVYINYLCGPKRSNEFVKCSTLQGEMDGCFGPELGLAEKLHEKYPDRQFFIIKCAWGGSNLFKQWLSPSSWGKTGILYKNFVNFVETSMEYLKSKNYDVTIEAMCWMQGESDSLSIDDAVDYENHLNNLIKDLRHKFEPYASKDGIAFVDAYIADNPSFWVYCEQVNNSKKSVAEKSHLNVVIDTVSHGLSCSEEPANAPDIAHYDSMSQIKLGHLFAEEASNFFD